MGIRGNLAGATPLPLEQLRRQAAQAEAEPPPDLTTPIDRSKLFVCPTLTALYYTPVYGELSPEQARRYNQINGVAFGELIGLFEEHFAVRALAAIELDRTAPRALREYARCLIAEEQRHMSLWWRLNRLCEPGWYERGPRRIVRVPRPAEGPGR